MKQIDIDSAAGGGGTAVTVDGSGNVYTVGYDHTKYKGNSGVKWTVRKGTLAGGKWSFSTVDQPLQVTGRAYGVTVAPSGVYVVGNYNNNWTIRKSATGATGTWTTVDTLSGGGAQGVATDAGGNVFVVGAGSRSDWIVRESANGSSWATVDDFTGAFTNPVAMAITRDGSGYMVVAGQAFDNVTNLSHSVVRTNAGGSWTTLDDYSYPSGDTHYDAVAADSAGNLYSGGDVTDDNTFDNWMIRSQPAAPTNLTATTDPTHSTSQINLTWINVAGSDETGFAVYRSTDGTNFTQVATLGASSTTYSDTGLRSGTTYYYYVVSLLNLTGMSWASNQSVASTSAQ